MFFFFGGFGGDFSVQRSSLCTTLSSSPLLIEIFDVALMALGESIHDDLVALVHQALDVVCPLALGIEGLVNDEAEGMALDEGEALLTRQDVEGAVDGHRDDGELEGVGKLKTAAAEEAHVACEGAGSLGENAERGSALKDAASVDHSLGNGSAATLVDSDEAGFAAGHADEGNIEEALLHHPLEFMMEEGVDDEDVEGSLMVGHEDVALVLLHILAALDGDGDEQQAQDAPSPETAYVGSAPTGAADKRGDGDGEAAQEGDEESDGEDYDELIKFVKHG